MFAVSHLQQYDGCSSKIGFANNDGSFKFKVLIPHLPAWIKKTNDIASQRVECCKSCDILSFISITFDVNECKIALACVAAMFYWDDMIDLMRIRGASLMQVAILA